MTSASERFLRIIERRAPLEWYRLVGDVDAEGRCTPPLVVWRFKEPSDELEERLQGIVSAYVGAVEWLLERPGRNWVLVPRRVVDLQRERSLSTDSEAIRNLIAEDQAFCSAAVRDLERLVELADAALG